MKRKKYLYLGIVLLVTGVVLRTLGLWGYTPYFLIVLGAVSKITFMYQSLKSRGLKLGYELLVLYAGLIIFFSGMYLRNNNLWEFAWLMMIVGIFFKVSFVGLFVRRLKTKKR